MGVEASVNYLSDLDQTLPGDADKEYQGAEHLRNVKKALRQSFPNVDGAVALTDEQMNGLAGLKLCGFPVDSSGAYLVDLTYNETTRTVTLTPSGASFDIYVQGVKYTKTGAQSLAHAATQGGNFVYYDATGTLVTSISAWDLTLHAPVCYVLWDATNSRGLAFDERHHAGRDVYWHRNQHAAEGTKTTSGFGLSGYTLSDGSADTAVTWAVASGVVEDEDIKITTDALPDNGPYVILERSGASGAWQITRTNTLPFLYSGNVLQYNQNNGGTWQRTNLAEDTYVNYYVFAETALPVGKLTPSPSATQQIVIVPGQATYATAALANAETTAALAWGDTPLLEMAPLYQLTMRYNASAPSAYANTARCAIMSATRLVGTFASIAQAAVSDHGSLGGLSDDDHPQYVLVDGTRVMTGDLALGAGKGVVFEGTTDDAFETTLTAGEPTADRAIVLPNASTTLAGLAVAQTFTAEQTFVETKDTVYTISDGAAFEIDPANGNIQVVTLGASRTPAATNFAAGQAVLLGIDDGTTYSITWTTVNPTWVKPGGTGAAPTLATSGYTWVLLWKVGSTIYAAEVGKP